MCLYAQIAEYRNRASGTMPWYRRGQSGTKPWYRPKRSKNTPHHCKEKCGSKQVGCSCRAMCLYAQIAEYRNRASVTMAWYRRGQSGACACVCAHLCCVACARDCLSRHTQICHSFQAKATTSALRFMSPLIIMTLAACVGS